MAGDRAGESERKGAGGSDPGARFGSPAARGWLNGSPRIDWKRTVVARQPVRFGSFVFFFFPFLANEFTKRKRDIRHGRDSAASLR
jgi:hypothetical protein